MKQQILQQFFIDLAEPKTLEKHLFCTGTPSNDARPWAKNNGTLILYDNRLLCRTDDESLTQKLQETYDDCPAEWFGEISNLKHLECLLNQYDYTMVDYGPFFIPQKNESFDSSSYRFYTDDEIHQFQGNEAFEECFMFDPQHPDLLGISLERDGKTIAMVGMNQTGKYCLELGIQVLPEFQHQEIATQLVKAMAYEAQQRYPDKVLTYGTQFTHSQSINVAIKSGFIHSWTEIVLSKKVSNCISMNKKYSERIA